MNPDSLVIIPTYNEKNNIESIINEVLSRGEEFEILIIDDNSPDGTGEIVKNMKEEDRIHLIEREGKLGLGSAYVKGFRWALERNYRYIFEMDADFSHNPDELPKIRKELQQGSDLVIGSRYKTGINVVNWPISRLFLSYFANIFAKKVTGVPLTDVTSGFKGFRKEVLEEIDMERIDAEGYGFQIEVHFYAYLNGFQLKEIPIVFVERREGNSKMSREIIWEAFWIVWKLGFKRLFKIK